MFKTEKNNHKEATKEGLNGKQLEVFEAGTGFMLAFPKLEGNGTVQFILTRTNYAMFGLVLSCIGIIYIALRLQLGSKIYNRLKRHPLGKV